LRKLRSALVLSSLLCLGVVVLFHLALRPALATQGGNANLISPRLCFTLKIPGDWHPGEDPGTYHSSDGKQFVEVLDLNMNDLKRYSGNTLVEKEAAALVQIHERAFRRKLADVTLAPFESALPSTWKWAAVRPDDKRARKYQSPKRYLIDLSPDGVVVLNIQNAPDDDALARSIIATLKHSEERPCQLPRSVNELLASAGIRQGDSASSPMATYNNALYGWSVSYPEGWKVEDSKPEFVLIQSPDQRGHCGIHTVGVEFKTAAEFADFMLTAREKHFRNVKSLLRQPVKLPSGLTGIESLADIQATGRSHQVFAVVDGTGYIVDCEANITDWGKTASLFERVIRSFSISNLAALTDADAAPTRTFSHPRHPWSIAYPSGWKLDASDPERVGILRQDSRELPDGADYAGCVVMSRPGTQFTSLDDFADSSLRRNVDSMQEDGIQVRASSRKNIPLPNSVAGIEVMREMSNGGRSRVVFILADGMSYILDCETSVRMWDTLAPVFDKTINSFTVEKKQ